MFILLIPVSCLSMNCCAESTQMNQIYSNQNQSQLLTIWQIRYKVNRVCVSKRVRFICICTWTCFSLDLWLLWKICFVLSFLLQDGCQEVKLLHHWSMYEWSQLVDGKRIKDLILLIFDSLMLSFCPDSISSSSGLGLTFYNGVLHDSYTYYCLSICYQM